MSVVRLARSHGLAGATVMPGILGFGRSGRLRRDVVTRSECPVVVLLVDREDAVLRFLEVLGEDFLRQHLVLVERVDRLDRRRVGS